MNIGSPGTNSGTTRHAADFCSLAFLHDYHRPDTKSSFTFPFESADMKDRTSLISEDIEAVRENVLALSKKTSGSVSITTTRVPWTRALPSNEPINGKS